MTAYPHREEICNTPKSDQDDGFRREGYQIVSNSGTARSLASLVISGA